ncbi:MAG: OmpH family outer membrane protein [Legionella sp.]|nr:OmpH family outer membrane protein [Legionella sp.]
MNTVARWLIASMLSLSTVGAFAEGMKIGVVDLQKIMQTTPEMKTIQQKLENDFKARRDKLVAMEENLKKDMAKLKRESEVMNQAQKKDLEKKIIEAQQTFEREGQQYQQEATAAHNQAMEGLYSKVRKAIDSVANSEKYTLILQKDAAPFSGTSMDVTDAVIKKIS